MRAAMCLLCTALLVNILTTAAFAQADGLRFVHASDPTLAGSSGEETDAGGHAAVVGMLFDEIARLEPQPAFVVTTGDLTANGGDEQFAAYRQALELLTIPHHDAPGNEDVARIGKQGFVDRTGQSLYRSWEEGGVHFIRLDSTVAFQPYGHIDQAQLDWLARDLRRTGTETPVVIALHHWVGRDRPLIDNERELLELTAPYNVRLWLTGHGRADLVWNVNGAAALMVKPLRDGSYHLIEATEDGTALRVSRRQWAGSVRRTRDADVVNMADVQWVDVATIPLARPADGPEWSVLASVQGNRLNVTATGGLPADASLGCRIDGDRAVAMKRGPEGAWSLARPAHTLEPGRHEIAVRATLPDSRAHDRYATLEVPPVLSSAPAWTGTVGEAVQAPLATHRDQVYAGTLGGDLVVLSPDDGTELWRYATGGGAILAAPVFDRDTAFIAASDGVVRAIDTNTRDSAWEHGAGAPVYAGLAFAQGVVCAATLEGAIVGLDGNTGEVRWTAQADGAVTIGVATDGRRFFVVDQAGVVRALDATTGNERWTAPWSDGTPDAPPAVGGRPVVAAGAVIVASAEGLLALHGGTGELLWERAPATPGAAGRLTFDGDRLYVPIGGPGRIACLSARTGEPLWDALVSSPVEAAPVVNGPHLLVATAGGRIVALNMSDGRELWTYRTGATSFLSTPIVVAGRAVAVDLGGRTVAFAASP